MKMKRRDRFILLAALEYLSKNLENANKSMMTSPCYYCGGNCPNVENTKKCCERYLIDKEELYGGTQHIMCDLSDEIDFVITKEHLSRTIKKALKIERIDADENNNGV